MRVGSHLGANPLFVREMVERALERHLTGPPASTIERIAWFHCEFEVIHPFFDGNGSIGRVLMNHQLLQARLPPVIVRTQSACRVLPRARHVLAQRPARRDDQAARAAGARGAAQAHRAPDEPEIVPLAQWARTVGMRGNIAANRAKRQTLPAFRMRDRWKIAADHRE